MLNGYLLNEYINEWTNELFEAWTSRWFTYKYFLGEKVINGFLGIV